ncbi:hypothetical protein BDZ94DRAFT_1298624 [Collybia nuda]|uniref:Transmembrane protein n=1 Tax=Collybia nuda TaxID=64659 RepID=A0A9P5Y2V7_9AGAR|nr:hypothetical protein BDZ94DRAFT_1298624 [Collybia nuda]
MPSFWTSIEDTSPLISYSRGWRAGHGSDDPSVKLYSQSSFMLTNSKNETASFVFNGTSIEVYGAKRSNHGFFQVQLDDQLFSNDGKADPDVFQRVLFSAHNLTQGLHTFTITNQDELFLDIDFIIWETTIGENTNDKLYLETFQDTSPSFAYLPSETDWGLQMSPVYMGSFMGGSGHATTTFDASFTFKFDGDGVSLYGPVGSNGSSYTAQLDNGNTKAFSSQMEFFTPQTLLYHADSLGPGTHNLTITYKGPGEKSFAIDYATVYTTTAPPSPDFPHQLPSVPSSSTRKLTSLDIGLITATAISSTLFLVISAIFLFWCHRRRGVKPIEPLPQVEPYLPTPSSLPPSAMYIQSTYPNQGVYTKERGGFRIVDDQPGGRLLFISLEH